MRLNIALLFCFCIGFFITSKGQTKDLGIPITLKGKIEKTNVFYSTPIVDVPFEKAQHHQSGEKMLHFGKEFHVSIDLMEEASISTLPSGDVVRQFGINCPEALSINLIFDKFHLAQGARLYLVAAEGEEYIGAYTSFNNNQNNMLGTELVHSAKLIVELYEPRESAGTSMLNLGTIVHGYDDLEAMVLKALNDSGSCHYDVNCPEGATWVNQRNSVAMMVNGSGFCTGALVHNTSGTVIPYFLSANHCGTSPGGWVFRFRWETPAGSTVCGTGGNSANGPENMNVNGGILRAAYAGSDFTLTELNTPPDPLWGIYYAGWDNTGNPVSSAVGIHHPSGDIKKISFENDPLTSSAWPGTPASSHWHVPGWDLGVTEPGSSGSPLFDQNHRVIGQLHGGASACGGSDLSDEYGKFSVSWNGNNTSASRLKDWLDPSNSGATIIEGYDPLGPSVALDAALNNPQGVSGTYCGVTVSPQVTITNFGTSVLTSATVNYGFDGVLNQNYTWNGSLAQYQTATITLPTTTLSGGNHSFDAVIINPNGATDQNALNNQITSSFTTVLNGQNATLNLTLDCWGSETSWHLYDAGGTSIYSGNGYSDNNAGLVQANFCLAAGCYTFTLLDSYGDGIGGAGCSTGSGEYNITYNSLIVAGLLAANADFGTTNSQNFCVTAGVEELDIASQVVLYPNPTSGECKVITSGINVDKVELLSTDGKLISTINSNAPLVSIPLNENAQGMYFVRITIGQEQITKQLIVK